MNNPSIKSHDQVKLFTMNNCDLNQTI